MIKNKILASLDILDTQVIKNALSNYGALFINGMISVFLIPVYISQLGPNQWGLVAVAMTLQGLFMIVDAGMSQILPSKISMTRTSNNQKTIFLASLKIYLLISLAIFIFGQIFSNMLLHTIFLRKDFDFEMIQVIFRLALLQFFFQLPNNAAMAYWNGRGEQHYANTRQLKFALLKHSSSIVLVLFNPSAVLYLFSFIFFSFFETALNSFKILGKDKKIFSTIFFAKKVFSIKEIQWVSAASILGMIGSQLDRLYLVRHLSLDLYGKYMAISTLAFMFMSLNGPIYKALLPNFSVIKLTKIKLRKAYLIIFLAAFVPCVLLAIFSNLLISYWLRETTYSLYISLSFIFLILGVGLNGLNGVPYMIYIRHGLYKNLFYLNLAIIIIEFFLLNFFYSDLSFFSGALAFFAGMLVQFIYGLFFMRSYLKQSN